MGGAGLGTLMIGEGVQGGAGLGTLMIGEGCKDYQYYTPPSFARRFVYVDPAVEEQCIKLCMINSVAAEAHSGGSGRAESRSSQLCAFMKAHAIACAASSPALSLHTQRWFRALADDKGFIEVAAPPPPGSYFVSAHDLSRIIIRSECMPFDQNKVTRGLSSVRNGYLYINLGHGRRPQPARPGHDDAPAGASGSAIAEGEE